jgi:hypothetical protein
VGDAMNSTSRYRIVAAGIIGNVLNWYDFAIYGYFAAAIGGHFFLSPGHVFTCCCFRHRT